MSFLHLVIKQMRQRSLSTWLTLLSVMLGVGLAISIMIFRREGEKLFGQSDYGYDLLIGAKGSRLQLVLNSVYHLDVSPGNIPYSMYQQLSVKDHPLVQWALPMAVGDEYNGYRVVASLPNLFPIDSQGQRIDRNKVFEYRLNQVLEFAEGRPFDPLKFEAVIGSEVAKQSDLRVGSAFKVQHGLADARRPGDIHDEKWTVVGILKETQTAADKAIYIPLISFYAIGEHEKGLQEMAQLEHGQTPGTSPSTQTAPEDNDADEHAGHHHSYDLRPDGTIHLHLPQEKWKVSAIFVRTRGGFESASLTWQMNNQPYAMAASPAIVMREFYSTFLKGTALMLWLIALLVTIVAAVSILVSIYNAVSARLREIAVLRALGATRQRVLALICVEAGAIGLLGSLAGLIIGHLLGAGASPFVQRLVGRRIAWLATDWGEWLYLVLVVVLAVVAGLVPALKAYRTPVATYLVSE